MTVWTIQPLTAVEQIAQTGVFRCDPQKSFNLSKPNSLRIPYRWLTAQMVRRIGKPPRGVVSPIWAWHTWDFMHRCPYPDSSAFLRRTEEKVLLTLEIPDSKLVLTDFDAWQNVMIGAYVPNAVNEIEAMQLEAHLSALSERELEAETMRSWENVFLTDPVNNETLVRGRYIQATFWEIQASYIREQRFLAPDTE